MTHIKRLIERDDVSIRGFWIQRSSAEENSVGVVNRDDRGDVLIIDDRWVVIAQRVHRLLVALSWALSDPSTHIRSIHADTVPQSDVSVLRHVNLVVDKLIDVVVVNVYRSAIAELGLASRLIKEFFGLSVNQLQKL